MAPEKEKPRKEQEKEEEDELVLEDGGIEESPRRSFEDGDDYEEGGDGGVDDDDEEEEERDGDGVGSPRSFQSRQWPQSYRCVCCCHLSINPLLDRRLLTQLFFLENISRVS